MKSFLSFLLFTPVVLFAQVSIDTNLVKNNYQTAFNEINDMLFGIKELDFKRAVFVTENAFLENSLDYAEFCSVIDRYKKLAEQINNSRTLLYKETDKRKVSIYASVFTLMKDTTIVQLDSNLSAIHPPFTYDFNDFFGKNDWTKMFVTKLIATHQGNCHSLPILYKILVEEFGERAYLSLAPNHMYIKLQNKANGWYNTELTSGIFPIDAWLMASGYIHLSAIQNGTYLDTLSQEESIALCLIDLAQGYEKKLGIENGKFIINCCETALKFYPNFINALLVLAETKLYLIQSGTSDEKELEKLENIYKEIHNLGYRKMPEKMYLEWLLSLKEEKTKYQNLNINF